jgi:UDP-GlcNAc:undecaprenyl-phosphate/decaprenyl-phosphate GlcNAc-1-phosphate transferase
MLIIDYIFALILTFVLGLVLIPGVIFVAKKFNIVDQPNSERKIHKKNTPLLGGIAVYLAVSSILGIYYYFSSTLIYKNLLPKHLLGVFLGGLVLMIGGFLDDKYNLKAKFQLIFPVFAILIVIISGIGIDWITNPIDNNQLIRLDSIKTTIINLNGLPYKLTLLADIFTFVWLLAMLYTTKLLDGLDGLVGSITTVGAFFIFVTALINDNAQEDIALISIIFIGAILSFLIYNFNPAKIFFGEGGSLYAGFMLGVLSIISGSKVAVTLIVMGIPLLDMLWTILRRVMDGKNPLKSSDKKHLHHRFLDAGFSVRQTVLIFSSISLVLGIFAVFLQNYSFGLMLLLIMVLVIFILLTGYLYKIIKEKKSRLDSRI